MRHLAALDIKDFITIIWEIKFNICQVQPKNKPRIFPAYFFHLVSKCICILKDMNCMRHHFSQTIPVFKLFKFLFPPGPLSAQELTQRIYEHTNGIWNQHSLTLLHSERPKLYTILAFLSAIELKEGMQWWEQCAFLRLFSSLDAAKEKIWNIQVGFSIAAFLGQSQLHSINLGWHS